MGFRESLTKAGLRFEQPPANYDFSAIQGKTCFGRLLAEPNFHSGAEIRQRAEEMPRMVRRKMAWWDESAGAWVESERSEALIDSVSRAEVNNVSKGYNLVQDAELLDRLAQAVDDHDLKVVGGVHSRGNRLHMTAIAADGDRAIKILHDYSKEGRTIAGGFSFTNSYTSDLGIHVQASAIDTFCINYNPWGKILAERSMSHLQAGDLTAKVGEVLDLSLRSISKVQGLYNESHEVKLRGKGDEDEALWTLAGAGFTERPARYISSMRERLEPAIEKVGLTALTLNLAATAYATHVAPSANPQALRAHSNLAMKLLDPNRIEKFRESGRTIVSKWDEAGKKREEAKKAKAEAALIATRTSA